VIGLGVASASGDTAGTDPQRTPISYDPRRAKSMIMARDTATDLPTTPHTSPGDSARRRTPSHVARLGGRCT
jgi:hypothetical protein